MSASSKKKLRKEQAVEKMTEKQLAEQKEAKKLKVYSILAIAALAVLVAVALTVGIVRTVNNPNFMDKLFPAVTVGEHKITSTELNYYFIDEIDDFFNENGSYVSMMGLDASKPLDEQYISEGVTWAEDFLNAAAEAARETYALVDAANEAGFELPQEYIDEIDYTFSGMGANAFMSGLDVNGFLKLNYGPYASGASYRAYLENIALANAYYSEYVSSIEYSDEEIAEVDAENPAAFSNYSYNYYYLSASKYLTGGTEGEDGSITYSAEEKEASVKAAEKAAKSLVAASVKTVEDMDEAIAALDINADSTTAYSTALNNTSYSNVNSVIREWVTDSDRKAGDKACIPSTSTSTDEDGNETTTTVGYYVVLFNGSNSNEIPLVNVRHLLVGFSGGTTDENGNTVYSSEEKAAALEEAEGYLATWKQGDATEASFGALANMNSDDGDGTTGGLYENVYPGQMVTNFNNWCFDEKREAGDVEIIETEFGYHIMYFVSESDTNYREYLIANTLRSADAQVWYNERLAATPVSEINSKRVDTAIMLNISGPSTESDDSTDGTTENTTEAAE